MLPANPSDPRRLADVLPSVLSAIGGRADGLGLAAVSRALVVLVDGLGQLQLRAHRGHARTLGTASAVKGSSIVSGFPTTTASALTSLATGTRAGQHGLVGYDALVPGEGVRNQLREWGGPMDPLIHQRSQPLWSRARTAIVAEQKYARSGFTAATLRGGDYLGHDGLEDRVEAAIQALQTHQLVYLYIPELDRVGHRCGVDSDAWVGVLETVDSIVDRLARAATKAGAGMLVTADHGMVDVPPHRHLIVGDLLAGVEHIAGETRALQLHTAPDAEAASLARSLEAELGDAVWVATREQLADSGWLGSVHVDVLPRIGDVIVAARGRWALYVDESDPARAMVGQHGSFTDEELRVPLARFAAWA